jgi:hypothetical protein
LSRESFLDLLHGRTPTIREPNFLTPEQSFAFEKQLSHKLSPYKHNTGPLLQKVGVAQFEYQAQAAEDFQNRSNGKFSVRFTTEILITMSSRKSYLTRLILSFRRKRAILSRCG